MRSSRPKYLIWAAEKSGVRWCFENLVLSIVVLVVVAYLGNGAVVDLDQVTRGRVDLQTLVEGKSGLNCLGCYTNMSARVQYVRQALLYGFRITHAARCEVAAIGIKLASRAIAYGLS